MESYNQSFDEHFPYLHDAFTKEIPLFVTYLNMVVVLIVTTVVIIPAATIINIIWWTRELHTKYYFFVANLLAINIASITVQCILQYLIMILYLLHKNSNSTGVVLKHSALVLVTVLHLMSYVTNYFSC